MKCYPAWLDRSALPRALAYLRIASYWQSPDTSLLHWGQHRLGLSGKAARRWCRRAWWGLAAGELVRRKLSDRARRREVLQFVDLPDWSAFEDAHRRHQAVILAAAHMGPPKTAMHCVMELSAPTMIWTNKRDLPSWIGDESSTSFLDPTSSSERPTMLLKSALHLRNNGILMGAPDYWTGQRQISIEKFGRQWKFSLGIPTLAKRLNLPVFLLLALWKDYRLRLQYEQIVPPPEGLPEDDWYRDWIEAYWQKLETHIRSSPENIRALRWIPGFNRALVNGQDRSKT